MKKIFLIIFCFASALLAGCSENEQISMGKARGNDGNNVETAKIISEMETVNSVAVVSENGIVIAGIKLNDKSAGKETCDKVLKLLKERFPDEEYYIVGADEDWAEDVIELCLYTDGGMDKDVLEKRFDFLVGEKMGKD